MLYTNNMDCLFCKLGSGEIDSFTLYEDSDVRAFLDVNPLTIGHTVVIPKTHVIDIIDLSPELVGPLFSGVKAVTEMLAGALGAENFTIGINHGKMLGHPDIDHMHVHVIPRFEGDGGGDMHSIVKQPPEEDLSVIDKKIMEVNK